MTLALFAAATAALASPVQSPSVHVVDAKGAGDFTTLQAAVDAAADGDVLLVKSGNYGGLFVDGKSLHVAADVGESVLVGGAVRVAFLDEGQEVSLSGLQVVAPVFVPVPAIHVDGCDGAVIVQGCSVMGSTFAGTIQEGAIQVDQSQGVVLDGCLVTGATFGIGQRDGGPGLRIVDSDVYVYESVLRGGDGAETSVPTADGGDGVLVEGGSLYLSGTTVRGGAGGDGLSGGALGAGCTDGGDGGEGLVVLAGASIVRQVGGIVEGGDAGIATGESCFDGTVGDAMVPPAAVAVMPGVPRSLFATTPLRVRETATILLKGRPFEFAALHLSATLEPRFDHSLAAAVLPGSPSIPFLLGPLGATGQASFEVTVLPFTDPSLLAATIYVQGMFFGVQDGLTPGSGQAVLLLDEML